MEYCVTAMRKGVNTLLNEKRGQPWFVLYKKREEGTDSGGHINVGSNSMMVSRSVSLSQISAQEFGPLKHTGNKENRVFHSLVIPVC